VLNRKKARDPRYKIAYWNQNQKLEAVSTYLMLGNLSQTAIVTGIPLPTLKRWKTADWWKDYSLQLQSEDVQQLDSNLRRIVEKSMKTLEDRIDLGDHIYDQKTGKLARVPIKAHVALRITSELLDKRQDIHDEPPKEELEKTIDARLLKLAEEFSKFAVQQKTRTIDVPMVEVVEQ
jgi:hypothetical protein